MKTLISHRYTGEDPKIIEPLLLTVRDELDRRGVESFCTLYDAVDLKSRPYTSADVLNLAFQKIDECDFLFVVMTNNDKSEGMLMEIGYCIAKEIPVVVALKNSVTATYVPQLSSTVLRWDGGEDLARGIRRMSFNALRARAGSA